jgi:hypothetical protein
VDHLAMVNTDLGGLDSAVDPQKMINVYKECTAFRENIQILFDERIVPMLRLNEALKSDLQSVLEEAMNQLPSKAIFDKVIEQLCSQTASVLQNVAHIPGQFRRMNKPASYG